MYIFTDGENVKKHARLVGFSKTYRWFKSVIFMMLEMLFFGV